MPNQSAFKLKNSKGNAISDATLWKGKRKFVKIP
jgi:hypothetical protein